MPAFDDIQVELVAAGLVEDMAGPLVAAIEAEGLDLDDGGGAEAPVAGTAYAVRPIAGRPGWKTHEVTIGTLGVYVWIETAAGEHLPASLAAAGVDLSGLAAKTRQIIAGAGLSGGGDLTADRTLAMVHDPLSRRTFGAHATLSASGSTITWTAWGCAVTSAGTVTNADAADGAWRCVSSSSSQQRSFSIIIGRLDWLPDVTIRIKTDATLPTDAFIGVWDTNGSSPLEFDDSDVLGLRYSTTQGDSGATWRLVHNNAANPTPTVIDTGAAIATGTVYFVRMRWTSAASAQMMISADGVAWTILGTVTSNLPTATGYFTFQYFLMETGGSARLIQAGRFFGSTIG